MPTLEKQLRAPAYEQNKCRLEKLSTVFAWLVSPLTRCWHRNPAKPYNNRQNCLECGAWREYRYTSDGIHIGKWRHDAPFAPRDRAIDDTIHAALTEPAQAPRPRRRFTEVATHCLDCGKTLDSFGACPSAKAADLSKMAAPVFCGLVNRGSEAILTPGSSNDLFQRVPRRPRTAFQHITEATNQIVDEHLGADSGKVVA